MTKKITKWLFYHGTSSRRLKSIMKHGLVPRGTVRGSGGNWKGMHASKPYVYLSYCFPMWYATTARKKDEDDYVLIRTWVHSYEMYPDEDYLCRSNQLILTGNGFHDRMTMWPPGVSLKERYRTVDVEGNKDLWADSFRYMGTVAVKSIAPERLDIRTVPGDSMELWCSLGGDLSLTPTAFALLGQKYRDALDDYFYRTDPPPEAT